MCMYMALGSTLSLLLLFVVCVFHNGKTDKFDELSGLARAVLSVAGSFAFSLSESVLYRLDLSRSALRALQRPSGSVPTK